MDWFLDTANLEDIKDCIDLLPSIIGVTTNPTFIKKEGIKNITLDFIEPLSHILDYVTKELHLEVLTKKDAKMIATLNKVGKVDCMYFVPKIPMVNWKLLNELLFELKDIYITNFHLISTLRQAMLAAELNATYICFMIGKYNDISNSYWEDELKAIIKTFKENKIKTKIMASSIRNEDQIDWCLYNGVDAITIKPEFIKTLPEHWTSESWYDQFKKDAK